MLSNATNQPKSNLVTRALRTHWSTSSDQRVTYRAPENSALGRPFWYTDRPEKKIGIGY